VVIQQSVKVGTRNPVKPIVDTPGGVHRRGIPKQSTKGTVLEATSQKAPKEEGTRREKKNGMGQFEGRGSVGEKKGKSEERKGKGNGDVEKNKGIDCSGG